MVDLHNPNSPELRHFTLFPKCTHLTTMDDQLLEVRTLQTTLTDHIAANNKKFAAYDSLLSQ